MATRLKAKIKRSRGHLYKFGKAFFVKRPFMLPAVEVEMRNGWWVRSVRNDLH